MILKNFNFKNHINKNTIFDENYTTKNNIKMQRLIILFSLVITTISCTKEENKNYDSQNEADILKYIELNKLNAQSTPSGLFYVIEKQGDGEQPNSNSNVLVSYEGTFLDGKSFDKSNEFGYAFNLQSVIAGWTEGIALFNEGGEGKLIIPSRLAFGNQDYNGIPAGSVMVFDIILISTEEGIDKINDDQITKYLLDNNIVAEKSTSGLYYNIDNVGTGSKPNVNSKVEVKYKGYFLNEETFDDNDGEAAEFDLQNLIPGFQEGLLHFNEGSTGTIIMPSSLGYGFFGSGSIPAGAVLLFDIELIKVD